VRAAPLLLGSAVAFSLAIGVAGARDLSGYSQIVAVQADGSGTKNVTHWRFDDDWAAVSPDGQKIAFVRNASAHGLWIMNPDGRGQRKLAMVPGSDELAPSWSPDGKRIAFVAMTPCEPYFCSDLALWVVRPDGSGLRRVAQNVRQPWRPLWSPDGTRLLFGQILNPHGEIDTLVVLRLADEATWTLGGGGGSPVSMFEDWSWSPDGRRVAYMASNGDTTDAYVEGARGRGRRLLAHFVYGVQWSPAGGEIAVIKRFGRSTVRLATVPVRGGLPRKIASADPFAWDRRGRRLALFQGANSVAVVDRTGRHLKTVSQRPGWFDRSETPAGPGPGPWSWSADGRTLFYPAGL
jgi:Tol biopolymer transport system component